MLPVRSCVLSSCIYDWTTLPAVLYTIRLYLRIDQPSIDHANRQILNTIQLYSGMVCATRKVLYTIRLQASIDHATRQVLYTIRLYSGMVCDNRQVQYTGTIWLQPSIDPPNAMAYILSGCIQAWTMLPARSYKLSGYIQGWSVLGPIYFLALFRDGPCYPLGPINYQAGFRDGLCYPLGP